jgi:hypothetical protein
MGVKRFKVEFTVETDQQIEWLRFSHNRVIYPVTGAQILVPDTALITEIEPSFVPGYFVYFDGPADEVKPVKWLDEDPRKFRFGDWRRVEVKEVKD